MLFIGCFHISVHLQHSTEINDCIVGTHSRMRTLAPICFVYSKCVFSLSMHLLSYHKNTCICVSILLRGISTLNCTIHFIMHQYKVYMLVSGMVCVNAFKINFRLIYTKCVPFKQTIIEMIFLFPLSEVLSLLPLDEVRNPIWMQCRI